MISTEELIASLADETRIIKHLFDKVNDDNIDWRPNEHQRSIRELLQFHLRMGVSVPMFLEAGYSPELAKQIRLDTEAVDLSEFPALMDEQLELVTEFLEGYSEEDLDEEVDMFGMGQTMSKRQYLFNIMFKNYVAYRMQLFLYLKMAGNFDLNTMNAWMGMDKPMPN